MGTQTSAVRTITEVPGRLLRVAGRARSSALDNALLATQVLATSIADRRTLAPDDVAEPGGFSRLDRAECLRLLASRQLGRLAYVARAGVPDIVPVNYALEGDDVVFRSGPGPKLQAAERRDRVAFEVDAIDDESHTGWSVVVVGRARRVSTAEADRMAAAPAPWALGPRRHLVRISPTRIEGRRLS